MLAALVWTIAAFAVTFICADDLKRISMEWFKVLKYYKIQLSAGIAVGLAAGIVVWFLCRFYLQPRISKRLGVGVTERDSLTDARTIDEKMPQPLKYDPRKFFTSTRKKQLMFLGVDERRKSVTLSRDVWRKTHVQVVGPTGTGKGVMACSCLAQSVSYGDGVYVFDPKNDEFAPSVLREACSRVGKSFHLLDLRRGQPAQLDILKNISKEDLNSLFIAGFALGEKGTDADYYRKNDRAAARHLSTMADHGPISLTKLAEQAGAVLPEDLVEKCEGFRRSIEEIAELQSVQAPAGSSSVQLDGPIKNGGCLYIIGSMDDEAVVVLQKMILLRIVQIVSARPRDGQQRHITVFADEIRYLMSKKLGDVLGSVRDKGCNLILAHQSLDDLKTGDVPSPAVVIDNTGLRWLYRSTTEEMAQWVAGQTGKIVVNKSSQKIEKNAAGGQVGRNETHVSQIERAKIDTNMVQHLPDGVAVVVGAGPARLAFSSPIPVEEKLDSSQLVESAKNSVNQPSSINGESQKSGEDCSFSCFWDEEEGE